MEVLAIKDGHAKLKNIPFALVMVFAYLSFLALISFGLSWSYDISFDIGLHDYSAELLTRVAVGAILIGLFNGILSIIGVFILALKVPFDKRPNQ